MFWQEEAEKHESKVHKAMQKEAADTEKDRKRKARLDAAVEKQMKKQEDAQEKLRLLKEKEEARANKKSKKWNTTPKEGTTSAEKRMEEAEQSTAARGKLAPKPKKRAEGFESAPAREKPVPEAKTGTEKQVPKPKKRAEGFEDGNDGAKRRKHDNPSEGKPFISDEDKAEAAKRLKTRPYMGSAGVSSDSRKKKADENYTILMETGIGELEFHAGLGEKKSYTMLPPQEPHLDGAVNIGVILVSSSFYVNKAILPKDQWPDGCGSLYTVMPSNASAW